MRKGRKEGRKEGRKVGRMERRKEWYLYKRSNDIWSQKIESQNVESDKRSKMTKGKKWEKVLFGFLWFDLLWFDHMSFDLFMFIIWKTFKKKYQKPTTPKCHFIVCIKENFKFKFQLYFWPIQSFVIFDLLSNLTFCHIRPFVIRPFVIRHYFIPPFVGTCQLFSWFMQRYTLYGLYLSPLPFPLHLKTSGKGYPKSWSKEYLSPPV